jgi:sugar phosphate isomerase/epimerase
MGGPLGAMSVVSAVRAGEREARYAELLETLAALAERARAEGLEALLVEPTPLTREIPSTIEEAQRLADDLRGRTAVPVRYVLDVGHATYEPLYGRPAPFAPWARALAADLGVLHLQNTDFQLDAHWGWPHPDGRVDVAAVVEATAAHAPDAPAILEIVHPFELDDDQMRAHLITSVEHCRARWPASG